MKPAHLGAGSWSPSPCVAGTSGVALELRSPDRRSCRSGPALRCCTLSCPAVAHLLQRKASLSWHALPTRGSGIQVVHVCCHICGPVSCSKWLIAPGLPAMALTCGLLVDQPSPGNLPCRKLGANGDCRHHRLIMRPTGISFH